MVRHLMNILRSRERRSKIITLTYAEGMLMRIKIGNMQEILL